MKKQLSVSNFFKFFRRDVWLAVILLLATACTESKNENDHSNNTLNKTQMEMEMKELKNNIDKVSTKADKQIEILENQLNEASDEAKKELRRTVDLLKLEQEKLAAKAKEASASTEQDWIRLKSEADKTVKEVDSAIDSLVNNVKTSLN